MKQNLIMDGMVAIDCGGEGRGRRGAVALLWDKEWEVIVNSFSLNHIDANACFQGRKEWRFTRIYGLPEDEYKMKTCRLLNSLRRDTEIPWLCGGDFNLMLWSTKMQGGEDFNFDQAASFRDALDQCSLEDLFYNGHPFT